MSKRQRPPSSSSFSKQLQLYKKSYRGGNAQDHPHHAVFQATQTLLCKTPSSSSKKVLYPGCHRHLTAALIFPNVTFVDYDSKVADLYHAENEIVKKYIDQHKVYTAPSTYDFFCCDITTTQQHQNIKKDEYDLVISLSAGILAESCAKFVKSNGYLLVNDSHSDARSAFVSDAWELAYAWVEDQDDEDDKNENGNGSRQRGRFDAEHLEDYFQVVEKKKMRQEEDGGGVKKKRKGLKPISEEQVRESIEVGAVAKRSFRMYRDAMFYLFRKK